MKITFSFLFVIIFVLFFQTSYAQKYDCGWYGKKTVEERNKIFPFNKAKKILLIAYSNHEMRIGKNGELIKMDNISLDVAKNIDPKIINKYEIKTEYGSKIYFSIEETELTEKWRNELSDMFINYKLKKTPKGIYSVSTTGCYTPRNSILFYDENDSIFCFYEVCFECGGSVMYPDPNNLDKYSNMDECQERLYIIKNFFKKNSIMYGISDK